MQALSQTAYQQLCEGAKLLEADSHGEKVWRLADGHFLKLFRRKRLLSSALFWPYAKRFAHNALVLTEAGIACPRVLGLYRLAEPVRDVVHYVPLPGLTLRQLREQPEDCPAELFQAFGAFMAELHERGVYFRSVHLGNVVLTPEQQLGLIDIADLKKQKRPLSAALRLRNFRHMLRDPQDKAWLASLRYGNFVQGYLSVSRQLEAEVIHRCLND